ncbi:hypothetical protein DPEC_G00098900 [Dallia pectoralis]|uniref:Uncharacterized protein n=1 Tax=Dallia pectoralis TaxID=75939 RepID=A0ACC2GW56_DALPE|nr:hypothetical protein DPEC_G00098900 [Dallia pectoralis]
MSAVTKQGLMSLCHPPLRPQEELHLFMVPAIPGDNISNATNTPGSEHFMYFAYGSNLLRERLQLNNPSAGFVSTGCLKDWVIKFGYWNKELNNSWHGGVATIEESKEDVVWGVVWKMDKDHLITLDRQEGVGKGLYSPFNVTVNTEDGEVVCRTYKMNNFTVHLTSPQYKQVVCLGAKQSGLPLDYIKKLEAVETNDYSGPSILDDITALKPSEKEKDLEMLPDKVQH